MIRKAFMMSVNIGCEAEYKRRHQPIWQELEAVLKDHGASNYSIFLNEKSRDLFAYVEIDTEERWASIAATQACRRWWDFMADIMPHNADNSPIDVPLCEVFHMP